MPRRSAKVEEIIQRIDEDLLTDLEQQPSQVRRWFTNNIVNRAISYLTGFTEEKKAKVVKVAHDGSIYVKQAGGVLLTKKMFTFDDMAIVEYFFPDFYYRFKIVDLYVEQGVKIYGQRKAAKITLSPGETIDIPFSAISASQPYSAIFGIYVTGTCEFKLFEMGLAERTATNRTGMLFPTAMIGNFPTIIRLSGGTDGGAVYFSFVVFEDWNDSEIRVADRFYYETITNTTLTVNITPAGSFGLCRGEMVFVQMYTEVKTDGNNALTVDFQIHSNDAWVTVATFSTTVTGWVALQATFPVKFENSGLYRFVYSTAGTAEVQRQFVKIYYVDRQEEYKNPHLETFNQTETSTTPVSYTVASYDRLMRLRDFKANVTIASGGGSVVIKINGNTVINASKSGTYTLPDIDNVYKVEVDIAGDGTNASSVDISYLAEEGAFLIN